MQVRTLLATTAATAAVSLLPISAQAATLFGNGGIQFDTPTTIRFSFEGSSNFYASNLSVYLTNSTGTFVDKVSAVPLFGETTGAFQDVTFLPGFTYTLGLRNFNPNDGTPGLSPYVFSTTAANNQTNLGPGLTPGSPDNPNNGQQRAFFSGAANPLLGPVFITFEDGGFDGFYLNPSNITLPGNLVITTPNDNDKDDFRLRAEVIPAPPLLMGLLALGARVFFRQRKSAQA